MVRLRILLILLVVKRALSLAIQQKLERVLRRSVEYAFETPNSSADYVQCYAQEMKKEVVDSHINIYVNDYSVSLGEKGRKAVEMVFKKEGPIRLPCVMLVKPRGEIIYRHVGKLNPLALKREILEVMGRSYSP